MKEKIALAIKDGIIEAFNDAIRNPEMFNIIDGLVAEAIQDMDFAYYDFESESVLLGPGDHAVTIPLDFMVESYRHVAEMSEAQRNHIRIQIKAIEKMISKMNELKDELLKESC